MSGVCTMHVGSVIHGLVSFDRKGRACPEPVCCCCDVSLDKKLCVTGSLSVYRDAGVNNVIDKPHPGKSNNTPSCFMQQ